MMSSPDGIQFAAMYGKPVVAHSDTQNVAFYDQQKQRYAGYIRIDNGSPPEHPTNETCRIQAPVRRIGRCDLGTKLDPPWPCTYKDAHDVFTFDDKDPACMDIYTNSVTQYYGIYLFFPSVFMHMQFAESGACVPVCLLASLPAYLPTCLPACLSLGLRNSLPFQRTRTTMAS
jgi:hypothetical protein